MQLFREAGKAVYSMPALLLQPIYVNIFFINFYEFIEVRPIEKKIIVSTDVPAHWPEHVRLDLLHALDRKRRYHL